MIKSVVVIQYDHKRFYLHFDCFGKYHLVVLSAFNFHQLHYLPESTVAIGIIWIKTKSFKLC